MGEWREVPFCKAFSVNPKVNIKRNDSLDFVDMQSLDANSRDVVASVKKEFTGSGSRFEHGDTLFARITPCLENGKIAQYMSLKNNKEAFGSTEFIVIRGCKDSSTNNFAYYFSRWDVFRNYAISQMTGSSGRQRVPVDSLNKFIVNLPDIATQERIASILSSLDDKIELNRKMNETLEEMARAIFKSWFVDFDPVHAKARGEKPAGMPDEIADLFPSEFVHSDQLNKPIPKGWEVIKVDDFVERLKVKSRYKKGDVLEYGNVPVFEQGDSIILGFHNNTPCFSPSKDTGLITFGDHTCRMKLFTEPFSVSENVIVLKSKTVNNYWAFYALENVQQFEEYRRHWMEFVAKHIILPPIELTGKFASIVQNLVEKQVSNKKESDVLKQLRDSLLPKLISGEIEV